jgi:hypothetical protein
MPVDLPNAYTLLTLTGIGVAPYATRGLRMTLEPLSQAGNFVRNINGGFVDLTDPIFKLYRVTISCTDQRAPPFGGLWPGQLVTLQSPVELGQMTLTSDRTAVSGSTNVEESVTYFRPQLSCIVLSFSQDAEEYASAYSWQLVLEELPSALPEELPPA